MVADLEAGAIITNIERRFKETESDFVREELQKYMAPRPCPTCKGARLKPEALAVTIAGRNIQEIVDYSVLHAREFFTALEERVAFEDRRNGQLKGNRHLAYERKTVTTGNLLLTVLDMYGVHNDKQGDSTGRLVKLA